MSDINPLTGAPLQAVQQAAPIRHEAKPQAAFQDNPLEKLKESFNSEEAEKFQMLSDRASRTKFATGDRNVDMGNYLKFKGLITGLLSFMDSPDER